ncbi:HAD family hydrolase [Limnovirga soli]|uniref:phosphoglycolate phosphatase n=1 Tax=Limnovirga soli TaxID=2656915 RepID=A0A8J8FFQ8_9BACT|nr:HAD family hydrolase [Limnovirga soli]NNV54279.1 HAD hydrolase-like protein [Limnovirga soli]
MQTIKAVIFDLDGTIANTLPLCVAAFRQAVEPLVQHTLSDEEIMATFGPSEEGTIMALAPQHYEKGIADYLRLYEEMHTLCPTAFEGIPTILSTLQSRPIRIAMVTGKGKYSTAISLQQFALTHYFEFIETGNAAGPCKPAGIEKITQLLSPIPKEQIIYVGDAPSDIIASRKVGIPVVAAAWAGTAEPEKLLALEPDELFYSIADFANWLYARI